MVPYSAIEPGQQWNNQLLYDVANTPAFSGPPRMVDSPQIIRKQSRELTALISLNCQSRIITFKKNREGRNVSIQVYLGLHFEGLTKYVIPVLIMPRQAVLCPFKRQNSTYFSFLFLFPAPSSLMPLMSPKASLFHLLPPLSIPFLWIKPPTLVLSAWRVCLSPLWALTHKVSHTQNHNSHYF